MADPQDRPDEGSGAIPPTPRKKAAPRKAPQKASAKAPKKVAKKAAARKVAAKKTPADGVKIAPRPAVPRPVSPPTPATGAPVGDNVAREAAAGTTSSMREAAGPVSPPAQAAPGAALNAAPGAGHTRIPLVIGLAVASLCAMLIRRLRRG